MAFAGSKAKSSKPNPTNIPGMQRNIGLGVSVRGKYDPAAGLRAMAASSPSIRSVEGRTGASSSGMVGRGDAYVPATTDTYARLGLGTNPEAPNSPSGNGGGNGGGMSGPVGPSLADLAKQAMDSKYANVEGVMGSARDANQNAFSEAQAKMAEFYGKAAEARKEPYASGVSELTDNLANLGMNFASNDLAKDWDKNERRLQENADLALANESSWVEKAKSMNGELYNQLLVELAQTKMAEQMAMQGGGGSGGGGRGRGGGGGSSKDGFSGDTAADENFLFETPGLAEALAAGGTTNNRRSLLYDKAGSVDGALADLAARSVLEGKYMNKPTKSVKIKSNPVATAKSILNRLAPTAARVSNTRTNSDTNFFRGWSPRYGPVQTNSKVNTTSKQKAK